MTDPDRSPIFVIGTGRSGTTLLRLMLNAHPRIYLTHEAAFWANSRGWPTDADPAEWLETYFRTFSFAWLRLDPEEVRAESRGDTLADAYRAVMRCKARHYAKPRYGDKTPFQLGHLGRLFEDFPHARVVHIVRDPRDTVASLVRMPWAPGSPFLAAHYYRLQVEQAAPFRDRMLEVRLEDLVARPRETMARVLEYVGEEWDDAVLDHHRHAPLDDVPPFPWLAAAKREVAPRREGPAWRRTLSPAWVRIVERITERAMREHGYEPAVLAREPSWAARSVAALADLPRGIAFLWRLGRAGRVLRPRRPPPVERAQEVFLGLNPRAWRHYPGFVPPGPPRPGGE